ncbi:hypothetical protein O3P69_000068 [Scylla paramamosain]|uniref:Uncharacterized protein n=1 Tax=Scylla paramamosain TaxID=85552 RepID=A0AAW0UYG3_SCYPA
MLGIVTRSPGIRSTSESGLSRESKQRDRPPIVSPAAGESTDNQRLTLRQGEEVDQGGVGRQRGKCKWGIQRRGQRGGDGCSSHGRMPLTIKRCSRVHMQADILFSSPIPQCPFPLPPPLPP